MRWSNSLASHGLPGLTVVLALALVASAQAAVVTGSYTGSGVAERDITGLGFQPAVVIVKAEDNESAVIRTDTMPINRSRHLVEQWGLYSNRITDLIADGFTLGNDSDVNAGGVIYHYIAFSDDPGYLTTGSYTGDGQPQQAIGGLGFTPAMVLLIPHGAPRCRIRTATMPAGASIGLGTDDMVGGVITDLESDGFRVGGSNDANRSGDDYSYVAFAAEAGSTHVGTYTGDGADGRAIAGLGFEPVWVMTKQFGSRRGAHRPASNVDPDQTLTFSPDNPFADGIVSLGADGFTLNGQNRVNENGHDYHFAAFASRVIVPTADVAIDLQVDDAAPELGDVVTITATITNHGPDQADQAVLHVDLPAGLTEQSATIDGGWTDNSSTATAIDVTWDIPAGETRQVVLTERIEHGADVRGLQGNAATDTADPVPGNDTATVDLTIPTVDVDLDLSSSDISPLPGQTVTLTYQVANPHATLPADVLADLVIPAGMTKNSATYDQGTWDGGLNRWDLGTLAAGATATLDLEVTVGNDQSGANLTPSASLTTSRNDDQLANNTADLLHTVDGLGADLTVSAVFAPATAQPGDAVDLAVSLTNQGPDDTPSFRTDVVLPAGLQYQSHTADAGSYDDATGQWTGAILAGGDTVLLTITATVDDPDPGVHQATAAVVPQVADPDADNNTATADLTSVGAFDLLADASWSPAAALAGDEVELLVTVTNQGPGAGPAFEAGITLPAGVTHLSHVAGDGTYDDATGTWTAASPLASGAVTQLVITAATAADAAGALAADVALTAQPGETDTSNDTASVELVLTPVTDLSLAADLDPGTAWPGIPATLTVTVTNQGPGSLDTCTVTMPTPADLGVTQTAGPGAWADGVWTHGDGLAPGGTAQFALSLEPTADATADFDLNALVAAVGSHDPTAANDTTVVTLLLGEPADLQVTVLPMDAEHRTMLPGGPATDLLRLRLTNLGGLPATLDSITLHNPVDSVPQDQADGYWDQLSLLSEGLLRVEMPAFQSGASTATALDLVIPAGDQIDLVVRGSIVTDVPDGVVLQPTILNAADFGLAGGLSLAGDWPLVAEGVLTVDGMTAAQITLHPVGAEVFQMGSVRNLALDVEIPGNGGQADVMTKLNVVNLGSAVPVTMVTGVEAWADDGDGLFDPAADPWIAELFWTGGQRFEASALSLDIPATGRRIFVSVDVAEDALAGTVQLSLPTGDDPAIGMLSGNDGPIDLAVSNPLQQTISSTDKIILTAATLPAQTVEPGDSHVPLLTLVALNLYDAEHTLERLRVRNHTQGTGDPGQAALDEVTETVRLHRDGNDNGLFDGPTIDPMLVSSTWDAGLATFEGVNWSLQPDQVTTLFVTASVSLTGAADGDQLGARIGSSADLRFDDDLAVVAAWPLDSGATHLVSGMVAAQIACPAVPPVSLTASEGPVLALDLGLPGNGYLGDTLDDLRLNNLGSARPVDIADLGLWADTDLDGVFDPATDTRVGSFTGVDDAWVALDLDLPIDAGGRRLFAGLTVTDTPTDSSTVRLSVARDGVVMASANDGPLDAPVDSPTSLLISTAPLLSTMEFATARSTTGMTVTVRMHVANVGGEAVESIVPEDLVITGDGSLTPVSGPEPASLDLAADGAAGTFTWTFNGELEGVTYATGRCEGVSAVGGQPRGSLATASAPHRVLQPALDLQLYPVVNMPFSINRGQQGVVPLTLTLLNDGGDDRAEIALNQLVVTLDDGDGAPVVPADLLSRVVVGEGVNIYADVDSPETSGQTITLPLSPPVVVTASEPVTLGLSLNIRPDTDVERFRLSLMSADHLAVTDNVSGEARSVSLTDASFPVRSAAGSIVAQATGLVIAATPMSDLTAGAGQDDITFLQLDLSAQGDGDGSEVKVGAFAVSLTDTAGRRLPNPQQILSRLWVEGPLAIHDVHEITGSADSLVVFEFSPQITVPVGAASLNVSVHGRLTDTPPLGPVMLHLEPADLVDARDGNVSSSVGVSYTPDEIDGPRVQIQEPAPDLLAAMTGLLPATLPRGAHDVDALTAHLEHPGPHGTAAVRLDTLSLPCLDADREPLDPGAIIDAFRVTWNGELIGGAATTQGNRLVIPLGGRLLSPGQSGTLGLVLDIEADAPAMGLEVLFEPTSLIAVDANLLHPISLTAAPGSSGLTTIQPAADEVQVAWTDLLPALLPTDGQATEAARVGLHNPADAATAPALLQSLTLRASDPDGLDLAAGEVLVGAAIVIDGVTWATIDDLAATDSTITLVGAEPLTLAGDTDQDLVILVTPRAGGAPPGVRFGLRDGDVVCTQVDGTTGVPVRAAEGAGWPFWTQASGLAAADLEASYINFPNPFAAGRQSTQFAFQLPRAATVSLRLWTPRGESVRTVLDEAVLAAGLHQDLTWDGVNGRGTVVRNGVYLAELRVRYDDGSSERLLRKVAVVR